MITVLPSIDIFEKYISNSRDNEFGYVFNILNNPKTDILITKNYLDFLELETNNSEYLESLIVEISDNNRLTIDYIDSEISDSNIYESIYNKNSTNIKCLFPISLENAYGISIYKFSKIDVSKKNTEYILFELLAYNFISFEYYDFNSNNEIQKFLKNIFKLPSKIKRISIYNRYSEYKYLTFLKHKSIYYYNLINGSYHSRKSEYQRINSDLKDNLGRNIVLKSIDDKDKIHERKIFFENFILTFDNSFDNCLVEEPNWKIVLEIDRLECYLQWSKKNNLFKVIN